MPRSDPGHHRAARRFAAISRWLLPLSRLCVLLAIVLLPVEMRAGASEAHPHSLLQLILDAADGSIDHHHTATATPAAHEHEHSAFECVVDPDVPAVEETGRAGGAPMLTALVLLVIVPVPPSGPVWGMHGVWREWLPALDPPPPRSGRCS